MAALTSQKYFHVSRGEKLVEIFTVFGSNTAIA